MIVDNRYDSWIIAITENIRSLRSSQLLKIDFHIIAGIVQSAGHMRSLPSLRSLCYVSIWSLGLLWSLQSLHWWFPLTCCDCWWSFTIAEISLASIWSLTIVTIAGIVVIAENIRLLWSSQLLKFDFYIVTGIIQIAGHIRSLWSSRSLWSLCYGFHMIAGIVTIITIAAVAALVVSINFLQSLMIVHDCYNRRDRLWFYPSDCDCCDHWQLLGLLAIACKMKIWFPYDHYDCWTLYQWSQWSWAIANNHMETRV